jgi:GH25 family lysozyme M1 (1,4-beta-N-acetylmuramidase)
MKIKGIDVSKYQGTIDWDKVKNAGIEVAIIRCGYGSNNDDVLFEKNYREARRVGIKVGVYLYSYATNITKARSEAQHVLRLLQNKTLDYPVFYDLEDANTTAKCSKTVIADMAEEFCNAIEKSGFKVGIYANKYWFTNVLTDSRFAKWDKWVAQYNKECTYSGTYIGWQYSSSGTVDGISGKVDMDEFYVDYTTTIVKSVSTDEIPDLTGYRGVSIVGALNSKGYDSTFAYRKKVAAAIGITNYKGTSEQNLLMIQKLGGSLTF